MIERPLYDASLLWELIIVCASVVLKPISVCIQSYHVFFDGYEKKIRINLSLAINNVQNK